MSIKDLDLVEERELKKCTLELLDLLCNESKVFKEWWFELDCEEELLLEKKMTYVLNKRINKHKFPKDE